ncbi:MAG: hypothetical protein CFE24_15080 [Flavobacterium sp. BFFFF2]|nr:MAG: hypothetical protein CFE24_15080 [Flavobacterium sp. BFFFF2]
MPNHLFSLKATQNRGKTRTILMVIDHFRNIAPQNIIYEYHYRNHEHHDICIVLKIQNTMVGLVSRGDHADELYENLERFQENGCTVILCPTHTYGFTVGVVQDFCVEYGFQHNVRNKRQSNDPALEDALNLQDFHEIVDDLNNAIALN